MAGPAEQILAAVTELRPDLLVMATHSRAGFICIDAGQRCQSCHLRSFMPGIDVIAVDGSGQKGSRRRSGRNRRRQMEVTYIQEAEDRG